MALLRITPLSWLALAGLLAAAVLPPAGAQEEDVVAAEKASPPPITITFTPPDLEGTIVLGIFDAAGKLVRTMRYEPGAPELKVDLNGYVASWDGRDAAGAPCPAGRYAARGYLVGGKLAVSGEAFHFNDWMAEDKIPATGAKLRAWPDGFGVELTAAGKPLFFKIRGDGTLEAAAEPPLTASLSPGNVAPSLTPPPIAWTPGRDGSTWLIVDDAGQHAVAQIAKDGTAERGLRVAPGEPQPVEILAAMNEDAILLKEAGADGVERVRMLRRAKNAAEEKDGKVVADWEVVFERTRQPCESFGVEAGKLVPALGAFAGYRPPANEITVPLVENALVPGHTELTLKATADGVGSALATRDGLKLVEISKDGGWRRFAFAPGGQPGTARLYQGDGIVVEEFALAGLDQIAAFDAGTFLLAAPAAQ